MYVKSIYSTIITLLISLEISWAINSITIINDTYNANLLSAKSVIDLLDNHYGERKIAIIGDMLELGDFEVKEHEELGEYINNKNIDIVIGVGKLIINSIDKIKSSSIKKRYFKTLNEANHYLKGIIKPHDIYYIKGSRGMGMEAIIKENFS